MGDVGACHEEGVRGECSGVRWLEEISRCLMRNGQLLCHHARKAPFLPHPTRKHCLWAGYFVYCVWKTKSKGWVNV